MLKNEELIRVMREKEKFNLSSKRSTEQCNVEVFHPAVCRFASRAEKNVVYIHTYTYYIYISARVPTHFVATELRSTYLYTYTYTNICIYIYGYQMSYTLNIYRIQNHTYISLQVMFAGH